MSKSKKNKIIYDRATAINVVYENISPELKGKYTKDQILEILETEDNFQSQSDESFQNKEESPKEDYWETLVNDIVFDLNLRNLPVTREEVDEVLDAEIIYLTQIGAIEAPEPDEEIRDWWKSLDTSWKNIFKQNFDINHNPTVDEIKQILLLKAINCSGKRILSLEPLLRLTNLEVLDCSKTQVRSLEKISHLNYLTELNCSSTLIDDLLPLQNLQSLSFLNISNTIITNLEPLGMLSNLQSVNCDYTRVTNIDPILLVPNISYDGTIVNNKIIDTSIQDEFFEEAARLIVQHQHGSTSLIQRKLKLGYNRAGRIIDQVEGAGIIGPFEGSSAREVNVKDLGTLEKFFSSSLANFADFKRKEEIAHARNQNANITTDMPNSSTTPPKNDPTVTKQETHSQLDAEQSDYAASDSESTKTLPRWISIIMVGAIIIVSILLYQKCK